LQNNLPFARAEGVCSALAISFILEKEMLETINVTKNFGGFTALKEVSLKLEEGELRGLIGPNGSGKTTLFNVISGVLKPNKGVIRFQGHDISSLSPDKICHLGIARTFQIPRPFRNMTVIENVILGVMFGERTKGKDDRDAYEEAQHFLLMVGLHAKDQTTPNELTAAGLKKLELARAIATKPNLLLADEFLSGLNREEIDQASNILRKIRDEMGITIIWIEHIMSALMNLVDRVTVLNYGEKIAEGTPQEVAANKDVIEAYLGKETSDVATD
jgi:branched-chain amino acid transport system ATP-binding protein